MSDMLPKDSAYICMTCGGAFVRGNLRCLVNHPSGTCCHEHDEPFLKPFDDPNPTVFFMVDSRLKFKKVPK